MYVTCHVLGASEKIKHLFMLDSKESVDILVCIFARSLASKALLQLIACSIKECTAKYWFQGFSCASVSGKHFCVASFKFLFSAHIPASPQFTT